MVKVIKANSNPYKAVRVWGIEANYRDCIRDNEYFVELKPWFEADPVFYGMIELELSVLEEVVVAFDVVLASNLIGDPVDVILGIV